MDPLISPDPLQQGANGAWFQEIITCPEADIPLIRLPSAATQVLRELPTPAEDLQEAGARAPAP